MKKIIMLSLVLFTVVGCSSKPLSKESVLKQIEKQESKITSYEQNMRLGVTINAYGQKSDAIAELYTEADRKNKNYQMSIENEDGENFEFIIQDGKTFLEDRPGVWKKTAKIDAEEFSQQTDYRVPIELMNTVADDLKMKVTEEDYRLQYKGYDKKLFKLLKKYYDVSFKDFTTNEDLMIEMEIQTDKQTLYVTEAKIRVIGKKKKTRIIIGVDIEQDRFNEIDKIEVPEEN